MTGEYCDQPNASIQSGEGDVSLPQAFAWLPGKPSSKPLVQKRLNSLITLPSIPNFQIQDEPVSAEDGQQNQRLLALFACLSLLAHGLVLAAGLLLAVSYEPPSVALPSLSVTLALPQQGIQGKITSSQTKASALKEKPKPFQADKPELSTVIEETPKQKVVERSQERPIRQNLAKETLAEKKLLTDTLFTVTEKSSLTPLSSVKTPAKVKQPAQVAAAQQQSQDKPDADIKPKASELNKEQFHPNTKAALKENPIEHIQNSPEQPLDQVIENTAVSSQPASQHSPSMSGQKVMATRQGENNYQALVKAMIEDKKHYPRKARMRGHEGEVMIQLTLSQKGTILSLEITQSSGYHHLDRAAIKSIHACAPFPEFPKTLSQSELTMDIPFGFRLL